MGAMAAARAQGQGWWSSSREGQQELEGLEHRADEGPGVSSLEKPQRGPCFSLDLPEKGL